MEYFEKIQEAVSKDAAQEDFFAAYLLLCYRHFQINGDSTSNRSA